MQDAATSSVGAQKMDTSVHQMSDLEDIEFHWEGLDLKMDIVCGSGIPPRFRQQRLTAWKGEG